MPFDTFLRLCVLRAQPQDLPASTVLLAGALVAHVVVSWLTVPPTVSLPSGFAAAVLDTVLLVAVVHTALLLKNHGARARQTLSALAGCGAILALLAFAALWLTRDSVSPALVVLPFLAWYVLVFAHVLRHALSTSFGAGLLLATAYLVLSLGVSGALIGAPEG